MGKLLADLKATSKAETVKAKRRPAPKQSQQKALQAQPVHNLPPARTLAPERQSMMMPRGGEIRYEEKYCGVINCTWRGSAKDVESGGWKEVLEHMRLHGHFTPQPQASHEL